MKLKIETDDKDDISLDKIIHMVIDSSEADKDSPIFQFITAHDREIMDEIRKYSKSMKDAGISNATDQEAEDMIEGLSASLFDTILITNYDYLKYGMKMGAKLLMELTA